MLAVASTVVYSVGMEVEIARWWWDDLERKWNSENPNDFNLTEVNDGKLVGPNELWWMNERVCMVEDGCHDEMMDQIETPIANVRSRWLLLIAIWVQRLLPSKSDINLLSCYIRSTVKKSGFHWWCGDWAGPFNIIVITLHLQRSRWLFHMKR